MTESPQTPPIGMTGPDEEAPYGRKADGTPRAKPGRRTGSNPSTRRPPARKPAPASAETDFKTPLLGLFQIPAGALAIAGMQKPVYSADAAAVTIHSENIADALDQLAHERPEIAAVLERVLQVGPYGVLIAAVAPMALQILANHNVVPAGTMGTVPPHVLLENFTGQEINPTVFAHPNGERGNDGDDSAVSPDAG